MDKRMEIERLLAELQAREQDPLRFAAGRLTPRQRGFYETTAREAIAEGGNQSGKTWAMCVAFLAAAVGVRGNPPAERREWNGWYATTTYELFAEQAWGHWRNLLLWPGESVHHLPTRRILEIGWDKKAPERVKYLKLRRDRGGVAEVYVKSYDQGRGEFQSATVDCLALDEECGPEIYEEAQPRVIARGGQILVACTPVVGVRWLEQLRAAAEEGRGGVFHVRLPTRENPAIREEEIARLEEKWRDRPELARLRLEGFPLALEGLIYPDSLFLREHVCDAYQVPAEWTRYRCVDHGFRCTAALWIAVGPGSPGPVVAYREYYGEDRRIVENSRAIAAMSAGEQYAGSWIDPATLGAEAETGRRVVDLYREHGLDVQPAPDNRVQAGIERVGDLLGERVANGRPRFHVFRHLQHFLAERRSYSWQPERPRGDAGAEKPVKRGDHLMDCWRYMVAAGMAFRPRPRPVPPAGTLGRRMFDRRRMLENEKRVRL